MQDIRVILQIEDDVLIEEVIRPLQKERKFSKLIVELLNAYYKDAYVNARATISLESKESSSREELLESLKGMRDNIEALQFLNEETKNLTDDGSELFSTIVTSTDKEDKSTEIKMLNSSNYVTREEFNALIEGQNQILELLKSGSLVEKAKGTETTKATPKESVSTENKEVSFEKEWSLTETKEVLTEKEEPTASEGDVDGSDIAASLLAGMDFNF